jgi:hypothetical protein
MAVRQLLLPSAANDIASDSSLRQVIVRVLLRMP